MHPFLEYLLKANLLLVFFGLFYLIFLKRETFYQLNRWYLIGSIIVSAIAPFISFTKTVWVDPIPVEYYVSDSTNVIINEVVEEPSFLEAIDLQQSAVFVLLFISVVLIFRKMFAIAKLYRSIKKLPNLGDSNIKINTNTETVYSFYKWIVVPENFFQWQNHQLILDHESIHLNQKHTFDLILVEMVAAVFWFNPLIKILQRHINSNLEFIVDAQMVQKTEPVLYQKNLLLFQAQKTIQFANSYSTSEIKSRILQLNSKKSTNMKKLKFLLATPALIAFFALFQVETVAQVKETIEVQEVSEGDTLEDSFYIQIHSKYDDEYYESVTKKLLKEIDFEVNFYDLKRNKDGDLTDIKISYVKEHPIIFGRYSAENGKPFEPFKLHIYKKGSGYTLDVVSDKVEYNEIILKEEEVSFNAETLKTNRQVFDEVVSKFPVIIDGVAFSKKQLKNFDNSKIQSMSWNVDPNAKKRMTLLLSTKKEEQIIISQTPQKYKFVMPSYKKSKFVNNSLKQGKTVIIKGEPTKAKIIANNEVSSEPLRLSSSIYDYSTVNVTRPYNPSQHRTVEEIYTISKNGEGNNTKRTVYKDASGKILKVEDANDEKSTVGSIRFVTSNVVYVIDGKIVIEDDFRKIDPNDIERIDVLKDQKSKEKYAATTKEAVMVITTKAKKKDSLKVSNRGGREFFEKLKKRAEELKAEQEQKRTNFSNANKQAQQKREALINRKKELLAERKQKLNERKKEIEKLKQIKKDLETVTSIFNDVKEIKKIEDEQFKITKISASITREDGTKVELSEDY
ncbi:hypothetical protein MG290_05320 [Flavobacterium sp. CBA20B-1]|uniref:M56 family metallopeptidase n=1 Tax=unclassified Flavobacterium TaxID=196869 RepID=UPI0022247A29|nr:MULTISPECIES: M56 family metallopeptidase [unclassified Flavobacterium]WCM43092.1 hypothetical protein MG290_05320 [Flavobacterium sp. CBA20B-1]